MLVLNCPAVGILGFQRELALAGRVEVGGVFCPLHSSENQAAVIPSGLSAVPGKGCKTGGVGGGGGEYKLTFAHCGICSNGGKLGCL